MLIYSETVVLLNIFWNLLLFSLINKKLKEHLFKIEIFSNNISLYYQFYPCNTSLLNKVSLNFLKVSLKRKKNILTPNFWIVYIVTQNLYFE